LLMLSSSVLFFSSSSFDNLLDSIHLVNLYPHVQLKGYTYIRSISLLQKDS
jgi:hypothetical protein